MKKKGHRFQCTLIQLEQTGKSHQHDLRMKWITVRNKNCFPSEPSLNKKDQQGSVPCQGKKRHPGKISKLKVKSG